MTIATDQFRPGQTVTVTQQIPQRDEVWTTRVTGQVIRFEQKKTGSWFAHAKNDKLWLDRLVLRKPDGEIVICNLDPYTHVDLLSESKREPEADSPSATAADPDAGQEQLQEPS